jgi:V/A-type H+-transporting ATPase subunit I
LKEAGLDIHFYSISAKKFKQEWLENYPVEIIDQTDREIKFIVIGHLEKKFEGAHKQHPPHQQAADLLRQVQSLEAEIEQTETRLGEIATNHWQLLLDRLQTIDIRLQWLNVWDHPTSQVGEGAIQLLETWVPVTEEEKLKQYLDKNGIFYIQSLASIDERPPVFLHNNRFGRLFEPIAKLFSLPAYEELDLTIYFAPFFMLFFGFCLGDAGYGLVLLLGSTIAKRFVSSETKSFLTLGQLFGASTLVMGLIFGTFFGIELAKVPALDNVREMFLESEQVFTLALIVGAIQIIFGIILRVKNQLKQAYPFQALSSVGWLLLFFTAGLFEFILKSPVPSPVLKIAETSLFILSGLLILFFSGTGPIHMRMIGGIWEMYNTVTGIFGDLLSYIRLFALGIASSILGLVINQMAVSFGQAPYIGPVIFFLIIVVGHTANIAISSLGAFVHPMRLTFVEFYKNAGFKGGGKPYQPFAKQKK